MAETASANRRNVKAPRDPGAGSSPYRPRISPPVPGRIRQCAELADDGRDTPRGHAVTVQRTAGSSLAARGLGRRDERPAPSSGPVTWRGPRPCVSGATALRRRDQPPNGATAKDCGTYVLRYRDREHVNESGHGGLPAGVVPAAARAWRVTGEGFPSVRVMTAFDPRWLSARSRGLLWGSFPRDRWEPAAPSPVARGLSRCAGVMGRVAARWVRLRSRQILPGDDGGDVL
jgi:hypothetical protein